MHALIAEAVGCGAFSWAMVLPFFLVLRWKGFGFLVAILAGWFIVHLANLFRNQVHPNRESAVFLGLWVALGWAYMLVWCGMVTVTIAAFRALLRRWQRKILDDLRNETTAHHVR